MAQAPGSPADCRSGCTSNDVQILSAYLSDAYGAELDGNFVCGTGDVYLSLVLSTNTPRIGVSIYSDVYTWNETTKLPGVNTNHPVSQCFGIELKGDHNVVTFSAPLVWDCQPIVLVNTYTAWGTGNTNFCTGSAFQCGATPSKCHTLKPGEFIPIQTPTTTSASGAKCSELAGSYQAHLDLTALKGDIVTTPANYDFSFYSESDLLAGHLISTTTNF